MATAAAGVERLGELLVREGLITREQLQQALEQQQGSGQRLGYVLVKSGMVQEIEITKMLARQLRVCLRSTSGAVRGGSPKIVKLVPG